MINDESHQLLSAHLDGETTPDERAQVEALLAESEAARLAWDELQEDAAALRETLQVPAAAPSDLVTSVMAEVAASDSPGRPSESVAVSPVPSPVPSHVVWLTSASGILVTAAVLLIAVSLFRESETDTGTSVADSTTTPDDGGLVDDGVALHRDVRASGSHDEFAARGESLEEGLAKRRERVNLPVPVPMPMVDVDPRDNAPSANGPNRQAPLDSADEDSDAMLAEKGKDRQRGLRFEGDLANARVGDVVRAMEAKGEEVAVVRLTVVDRRAGLEALQLLLARNDVRISDRESDSFVADPNSANATKPNELEEAREGGSLEAVYVEASAEQLVSTLDEMRAIAEFRRFEVDQPIAVASLESFNRNEGRADVESFLDSRRRGRKMAGQAVTGRGPNREVAMADQVPERLGGAGGPGPGQPGDTERKYDDDKSPARPFAEDEPSTDVPDATRSRATEPGEAVDAPAAEPADGFRGADPATVAEGTPGKIEEFERLRRLARRSAVQKNLLVPPALAAAKTRTVGNESDEKAEAEGDDPTRRTAQVEPPGERRFGASRASIPPMPRANYRPSPRLQVVFVIVAEPTAADPPAADDE